MSNVLFLFQVDSVSTSSGGVMAEVSVRVGEDVDHLKNCGRLYLRIREALRLADVLERGEAETGGVQIDFDHSKIDEWRENECCGEFCRSILEAEDK